MTVALIAPAFSPAIGGLIIDSLSWHWVFYSNLPFSLLTAVLAWIWIKNDGKNKRKARYFGANNGEFKFVKPIIIIFFL